MALFFYFFFGQPRGRLLYGVLSRARLPDAHRVIDLVMDIADAGDIPSSSAT